MWIILVRRRSENRSQVTKFANGLLPPLLSVVVFKVNDVDGCKMHYSIFQNLKYSTMDKQHLKSTISLTEVYLCMTTISLLHSSQSEYTQSAVILLNNRTGSKGSMGYLSFHFTWLSTVNNKCVCFCPVRCKWLVWSYLNQNVQQFWKKTCKVVFKPPKRFSVEANWVFSHCVGVG